jgi:hypothetical protein
VKKSAPIEFLRHAQQDAKTSARVKAALEKGAAVTNAEILKIAKSSGYKFTQNQFQRAVRKSYAERFAAGDRSLAAVMKKVKGPPESSCARGCLSWTVNWHPKATTKLA